MDIKDNNENKTKVNPELKNGKDVKLPTKKVKRKATQEQLNHPLHGVKLAYILESLVEYYGWKYLAREVNILCFKNNPTIPVSLKFLRKMTWAREHVEDIFMDMLEEEKYQRTQKNKRKE